ncbi:ABC transporter ATP-binding protein [Thalassobaculum sp.]|uniref:ABC transporter ATP-binding protein n=1 Tax=Thalassobaculum sp. TaxID=2022740 RepID=UPI0032EF68C9
MSIPVLAIDDLTVRIDPPDAPPVFPVRGVSLRVEPGETLGLVGESGCGKTLTCLAAMGLLGRRVAIAGGSVRVEGRQVAPPEPGRDGARTATLRHRRMAMIFQNPSGCLNPVRSIGWQVAEAYRLRTGAARAPARRRAVELLDLVGIPEPGRRARDYPHQLSGGQQQRAMIAIAIAGDPALLIADEATTALDVTVQAQILELLRRLQRETGMAILFVTHDLGLIAEMADRIAVMYAGQLIEHGPTAAVLAAPRHPYTAGLLDALPFIDEDVERLVPIEGTVPALDRLPHGCSFAPRCGRAGIDCAIHVPTLRGGPVQAACLHPLEAA